LNDWRVLDGCHFLNQDHILYSQKFNIEKSFYNVFLPNRLEFRRVNFLVSWKRPLYLSVNSREKKLTYQDCCRRPRLTPYSTYELFLYCLGALRALVIVIVTISGSDCHVNRPAHDKVSQTWR
jgi:hypothetical protein